MSAPIPPGATARERFILGLLAGMHDAPAGTDPAGASEWVQGYLAGFASAARAARALLVDEIEQDARMDEEDAEGARRDAEGARRDAQTAADLRPPNAELWRVTP